jgi:hypothetical protein
MCREKFKTFLKKKKIRGKPRSKNQGPHDPATFAESPAPTRSAGAADTTQSNDPTKYFTATPPKPSYSSPSFPHKKNTPLSLSRPKVAQPFPLTPFVRNNPKATTPPPSNSVTFPTSRNRGLRSFKIFPILLNRIG